MEVFFIALKAIMANKVRSFLTMLGVIIGVGSVVLLTSIGTGLQAFVTTQFNELGANTLYVFPGNIFGENGEFSPEQGQISLATSQLSVQDARAIEQLRNYVDQTSPFSLKVDTVSFRGKEKNTTVIGTTANFSETFNLPTQKGEFFSESDTSSGERVVILGSALAEELFGTIDPIGKRVKIGSQSFRVLGVAKEKGGGFGGPSFDTYMYIPLKTFSRSYDTEQISRIIVKIKSTDELEESIKAIEDTLEQYYDDDEFSVVDQSEILNTITQILGMLTVGLGGIAAISLVVGGIGIMNIMLVSVSERTREIGLRKALGATPNAILFQFLIEAALLSVIGGIIGIGVAFLGSLALQQFLPAAITPQSVVIAFTVSTLVGLIFGVAPAKRAANLSPIEALRYE